MRYAEILVIAAAGGMLLVASAMRGSAGQVEAAPGDWAGGLNAGAVAGGVEAAINRWTEAPADVSIDTAAANVAAFLAMIRQAEGTAGQPDPYRTCYGYRHRVVSLVDHPAASGEWSGEALSDGMCARAGFGPGCVSTAAGAYQIIRPTWARLRAAMGLPDFGAASQDAAAVELIRQRGALEDVKAGRVADAVHKCRAEWASLPGNAAGQGQRGMAQLVAWFAQQGGTLA